MGKVVSLGLQPKQVQAFNSRATEILYGGPLALDAMVVTPRGRVPMGDLVVGDMVLTPKGEFSRVTDIPFDGVEDSYEIEFTNGQKVVASAGHKWSVGTADWGKTQTPWRTLRTIDMVGNFKMGRNRCRYRLPNVEPYEGRQREFIIKPYTLGVLLADGCITNATNIFTPDQEVVDRVRSELPDRYKLIHRENFCYGLCKEKWGHDEVERTSVIRDELRRLNLYGHNAYQKFIPHEYLYASKRQRLDLLHGMMDSDGTVRGANRRAAEAKYSTVSERLRDDFVSLAESLGFHCTWHSEIMPNDKLIFRIQVARGTLNPFYLKRKRDRYAAHPVSTNYLMIKDISPVGKRRVRCITVEDRDALFVLDRNIVTHNSVGGGKSHLMRVALIAWCLQCRNLQCYIFRRVMDDLIKNHMQGATGFRALLHPWVESGDVEIIETEIRFKNGSRIFLCHLQQEKHKYKFQGAEIGVMVIDELTHFTESSYRFLRNRLRISDKSGIPEHMRDRFPRILCGSNPGNVGHLFVKKMFIDAAEPMKIWRTPHSEGGMLRQFIPARLTDNQALLAADPNYANRVAGLGSEALVKAMLEGDWDVIDGAFFDQWDAKRHVVDPFRVPAEWTRFVSMDWGYAKPFAVQWWAIADGRYGPFPRGAIICYREWYGIKTDEKGDFEPDTGVRLNAEEVRDGILERTGDERLAYVVCDPAMWGTQTGPSPAEIMYNETGKGLKSLKKANNKRTGERNQSGGWDQMRARLTGQECNDGEKRPLIYFFNTCLHAIRTIPAMVHDELKPEDMDTDGEDHLSDSTRYACMSRPIIIKRPQDGPRTPPAGHFESNGIIAPPMPQGWGMREEDLDR